MKLLNHKVARTLAAAAVAACAVAMLSVGAFAADVAIGEKDPTYGGYGVTESFFSSFWLDVTVITARPDPFAVTAPSFTTATAGLSVDHVTVLFNTFSGRTVTSS